MRCRRLHDAIKDECPPPYPSLFAAYREIIPALLRQRRDPDYHVARASAGNGNSCRAIDSLAQPA